jgi:hypothetical protein
MLAGLSMNGMSMILWTPKMAPTMLSMYEAEVSVSCATLLSVCLQGNVLTDAEGVKVRTVKLLATQNVGFESLPVQFVNKATKAGFVFNILVIGE